MAEQIKNLPELLKAYPEFVDFLNKMYSTWLKFMVSGREDERPAAISFIKNFTQAVPNEASVKHLVEYALATQEGSTADATACWIILVATDPDSALPEVDANLYTGWRDTRPESV